MSDENQTNQTPKSSRPTGNSLGIPIAIVIAAALIAGAIFFSNSDNSTVPGTPSQVDPETQVTPELTPITGLDASDHLRGNPEAQILMVEYSDFDCPFCKRFHDTLKSIMASNYGINGDVAWTYRQFPIQQLHPNAPAIAHASECVAENAGNEAFWAFADGYAAGEVTDETSLYSLVSKAGASEADVRACMNDGRYVESIQGEIVEAAGAGANGTPFTVFIFDGGMSDELKSLVPVLGAQYQNGGRSLFTVLSDDQLSMSGALPAEVITQIIEAQLGVGK